MDKVIISAKSNIPEEKLYTEKVIKDLQAENEQIKKDYAKLHIDFAKCNEENERLKEEKGGMQILINGYIELTDTYKQALQKIRDKLDFHEQELEECLYNPIDDKIREIINSVIGVE